MEYIINILIIIFYLLSLWIGNFICKYVFSKFKLSFDTKNTENKDQNAENNIQTGRLIGFFERILIGIGILLKSWEIVAGVIALKSISRYQELDKKINAEYFLIGSMISLIWAFFITFLFYLTTQILVKEQILSSNIFDAIKTF